MLKRVHVNQHIIRANQKNLSRMPPLTVKTSRENLKAESVEILGPSTVIYSPEKPLSCGARVWVQTEASVVVHSGDLTITLE